MADQVPQKFGKCHLAGKLGQGATATVYLARHEGLDIQVAVKVLRRKLSQQKPEYAERFLREARMSAWLEHPNIVRVIDCGIEDGYHYMVMDYVDGPDCLQMVNERPEGLGWREAADIIQQTATGLAYAAGKGVIHRDVKPSNIMIDSSGRVRVTDLGLAKLTAKGVVSLTQEMHTVGTPNYMSPEQIRSPSDLDLRTDIYSLGATLYHLVTGHPPFLGATSMAVVAQHLSAPLVTPREVKPDLSAPLSWVICKMMAKSPFERYQDYDELTRDLTSLLEGKPISAEGFEETQSVFQDEAELRRLLDELSAGASLALDDEAPSAAASRPAAGPAGVEGSSTEITPFGPNDFGAYEPSRPEPSDSTVLARQFLQVKSGNLAFIVALVVTGVIIVGVAALLVWLITT